MIRYVPIDFRLSLQKHCVFVCKLPLVKKKKMCEDKNTQEHNSIPLRWTQFTNTQWANVISADFYLNNWARECRGINT